MGVPQVPVVVWDLVKILLNLLTCKRLNGWLCCGLCRVEMIYTCFVPVIVLYTLCTNDGRLVMNLYIYSYTYIRIWQ